MIKWIVAILLGGILIVGSEMLFGGKFRLGYWIVGAFIYMYCTKDD